MEEPLKYIPTIWILELLRPAARAEVPDAPACEGLEIRVALARQILDDPLHLARSGTMDPIATKLWAFLVLNRSDDALRLADQIVGRTGTRSAALPKLVVMALLEGDDHRQLNRALVDLSQNFGWQSEHRTEVDRLARLAHDRLGQIRRTPAAAPPRSAAPD